MKKIFFAMPLLIFIFFAACGEAQRISPTGLPYAVSGYGAVEDEYFYDPYAEYDGENYFALEAIEPEMTQHMPDLSESGVLRLYMRPPITLNPLLNEDATVARILRLIFEPLAVLDNEFRVTGFLADLDFASDFGSVNATIREGAMWSDGIPVTAEDIIFSIDFLRNVPSGSIYGSKAENIESAVRINARTVLINFTRPSVMAGYSLTFPIIPQHFFSAASSDMYPPSSGAFAFESHTPMRSVRLGQNPFNSASIEEIEVILLPDTATDFYAFDRGRIDAIHLPLTEWMRHHGVRSPVYEVFPAMYFEFIGFNFRRGIFRESSTRQGIAHAFNANEAVAGLYLAHAVRSAVPIHPMNWAASNNILPPMYDPARAAALLGTLRIEEPLTIIANAENSQRVSLAHRLAASLTNAGLPANAEIMPSEEYFARIAAHDFDLFIGGMELPFAPDVQVFFQGGGLFVHDPVLEAAYNSLLFASTELAYTEAMSRLQQAFTEQLPVIGLAFKHSAVLANPRITSGLNPTPGFVFGDVSEWTME